MPKKAAKAAKKAPAKKSPARKKAAGTPRLRIRMYRQGLGDCFLLTFDGKFHVLIDCGVIVGTENPAVIMNRVVEDIHRTTGGKVDVLVVTHEHWDHVSGFRQAEKAFDKLDFKQVWMAWTEDDENSLANQLRRERKAKLKAAEAARKKLTSSTNEALGLMSEGIGEVLGFSGIGFGADAASGGDTGLAMKYARDRGKQNGSSLKLLHPEDPAFKLPGAGDVRVYVLGPPEDEKLIKKSDPSKAHSEVFMSPSVAFEAAVNGISSDDDEEVERAMPFAWEYRVPAPKGMPTAMTSTGKAFADPSPAMRSLFEGLNLYPEDAYYLKPDQAFRTIEDDWLVGAGSLALKLDSDTNNTSLVLAFEFTDTPEHEVFLFPGDAQVGNWLSWDKYEWNVKDPDGENRTVNATDILARTVFYKVGHHGSHNATLKELGLERMTTKGLVAMVPVNKAMARKKRWKMPWPKLRTRLEEKCSALIVQDEFDTVHKPRHGKVVVHKPDKAKGEPPEPLYIDYEYT